MEMHEYLAKYEKLFHKQMEELRDLEREFKAVYSSREHKASDIEKEEAGRLFSRVYATLLPYQYDNIDMTQSRGLETIYSVPTGEAIDLVPNGQKSCQIKLWSGMSCFENDPKKMETGVNA